MPLTTGTTKGATEMKVVDPHQMVSSADPALSRSIDAMNAALKTCPTLDHSIALLAYAIAITVLSQPEEARQTLLNGMGQCVHINLSAMDHAAGGVPAARMQ